MPNLYRVFPSLAGASLRQSGGPLHVPPQGGGRLDNPDLYSVLYASDAEAGAVAEAFGRFPEWTPAMLEGSPAIPGSFRAIGRYELAETAAVCDLDDAAQLVELHLRPSDVVSREYERTRDWARRIYRQAKWAGVRWWSYYDPRWSSFGVWDSRAVSVVDVRRLQLDDHAIREAARTISRRISTR